MKDNAYYEPLLKLYAQVNELGFIPDYSVLASSSYTANDGLIVDASHIFAENAEKFQGSIDNDLNTYCISEVGVNLQVDLKAAYKHIALKKCLRNIAFVCI